MDELPAGSAAAERAATAAGAVPLEAFVAASAADTTGAVAPAGSTHLRVPRPGLPASPGCRLAEEAGSSDEEVRPCPMDVAAALQDASALPGRRKCPARWALQSEA